MPYPVRPWLDTPVPRLSEGNSILTNESLRLPRLSIAANSAWSDPLIERAGYAQSSKSLILGRIQCVARSSVGNTAERQLYRCLPSKKIQKHSDTISSRHHACHNSVETRKCSSCHFHLVTWLECGCDFPNFLFAHQFSQRADRFIGHHGPKTSKMDYPGHAESVSHHI